MKVVHLQISRVISTNAENEPIYETYPIKLADDGRWTRFLDTIGVMQYVKSKTKVLKAVEVAKDGSITDTDHSEYQKQLIVAMNPVKDEPTDIKTELENEKAKNESLLKRIEALEASMSNKASDGVDLSDLIEQYTQKTGNVPPKTWGIKKLTEELSK